MDGIGSLEEIEAVVVSNFEERYCCANIVLRWGTTVLTKRAWLGRFAMAMTSTAIRFAPEERQWIQAYADMQGKSFSEVVREAALEAVEDACDLAAYRDALAEDDGTHYSLEEVIEAAMKAE